MLFMVLGICRSIAYDWILVIASFSSIISGGPMFVDNVQVGITSYGPASVSRQSQTAHILRSLVSCFLL